MQAACFHSHIKHKMNTSQTVQESGADNPQRSVFIQSIEEGAGRGAGDDAQRESLIMAAVASRVAREDGDELAVSFGGFALGLGGTGQGADRREWIASAASDAQRERRAAIVEEINKEQRLGRRALAVGRVAGWRAAEGLRYWRGVHPSFTSIEEAAAAGTAAAARVACEWTGELGAVLHLAMRRAAAIAARASLTSWGNLGMTGRNTAGRVYDIQHLGDELIETLRAEGAGAVEIPAWRGARFTVIRWVYAVGYRDFCKGLGAGAGAGAARRAARSRCRVIGNIIMGASLADACGLSGFGGVQAWQDSCNGAGLWQALRQSCSSQRDTCEESRIAVRRYGLEVATLTRQLRGMESPGVALSGEWRGTDTVGGQGKRGGAALQRRAAMRAIQAPCDKARAMARAWRRVQLARAARVECAYERVIQGLGASNWGDLRKLVGLPVARLTMPRGVNVLVSTLAGTVKIGRYMRRLTVGEESILRPYEPLVLSDESIGYKVTIRDLRLLKRSMGV